MNLQDLAYAITIVIGSWLVARIVNSFLGKYVSSITKRTKSELDDKLLDLAKGPIYYIIILAGLNLAFGYVLLPKYVGIFSSVISSILIVILAGVTASVLDIVLDEYGKKIAKKTKTTLDSEAMPFLSKVLKIGIYAVAITIILDRFGYSISPIIASLGVAGIAIAFAAKDTLSNLLGGFFIMIDKPFVIGDRIKIGDNIGEVMDVGLRTTKVKTFDHTLVVIPNSRIVSKELINYALPDVTIKGRVEVGVAYGSDVKKVKKILTDVAKACGALPEPEPMAYFTSFGDSSMNFLLRFWVDDFRKKFGVIDKINTEINNRFIKEGITIPFPIRTVYLKK